MNVIDLRRYLLVVQPLPDYVCPMQVVMLLVEAILFGLFTICMMADQSESISTNQTQIDRLKKEKFDIQVEI